MSVQMVGAPVEITFKDHKYIFHPLRDYDYGEFEAWAQDRYIAVAKRNIGDLPESDQKVILMNAFERASLITFSSKEARVLMGSVEGAAKLLHLSLRRGQPDITIEQVRELCTDPEFIIMAFNKVAQLMAPFFKEGETKKGGENFHERKSTKRSRKGTGGRRSR